MDDNLSNVLRRAQRRRDRDRTKIKIPRRTRRDEILDFIKAYALEKNGPTPTIREIQHHFGLAYTTIYAHVDLLLREGRIRREDGKIVIPGSRWIAPDDEEA